MHRKIVSQLLSIKHFKWLIILIFICSCTRHSSPINNKKTPDNEQFSQEQNTLITESLNEDEIVFQEPSRSLSSEILIDLSSHQEILNEFVNLDEQDVYEYTVRSKETLILVSYKLYGTIKMWRVLAKLNEPLLNLNYQLKKGMVLRYPVPKNKIERPPGLPYLIKTGDSLSLISDLVYGNYKKWPIIWKNNKKLIQDPNLIFAGFTLFYPQFPLIKTNYALKVFN